MPSYEKNHYRSYIYLRYFLNYYYQLFITSVHLIKDIVNAQNYLFLVDKLLKLIICENLFA